MEGMPLPKSYGAVILGKRLNGVYRELLNRNKTNCVYTSDESQALSVQRHLETKPRSKLDDPALTQEIMFWFKQDLSPNQIAGRLGAIYPEGKEKQVSPSTNA
ncbi:MAG: hypothetical protein LBL45_05150 [Treponema sp.]|jgi:IS30 family transposase|nr:hypothetical protein [Treponema sp.]